MIRNKNGYMSIEVMVLSGVIIGFLAIALNFFAYLYPLIELNSKVDILRKQAIVNGGLTYDDVELFKGNLGAMGENTTIEAYGLKTGVNALGVNDDYYITKESNEIIMIMIEAPANDYLGMFNEVNDGNYVLKRVVMSEKSEPVN